MATRLNPALSLQVFHYKGRVQGWASSPQGIEIFLPLWLLPIGMVTSWSTHQRKVTWSPHVTLTCGTQDPIAIVGILGIMLPFVILGIAIATGYVDVSPKVSLGR